MKDIDIDPNSLGLI